MTTLLFKNNAQSKLAYAIPANATTAYLTSGTGILFPQPTTGQGFYLTFYDAAGTSLVNEIVLVTGISGDQITSMVRAQQGTTAVNWAVGTAAAQLYTAGDAQAFDQSPADVTIGSSQVTGGTNGYVLYNNNGLLGNKTVIESVTAGTGITVTNPTSTSALVSATGIQTVSGTTGTISVTSGQNPTINLQSGVVSAGTVGSSALIPVITTDTYGRVTGVSTAANPQGTLTGLSVSSSNGFAGTVGSGASPAITLSTTVGAAGSEKLLKGNGTSISAATAGTDYAPATSGTASQLLANNGSGGFSNVTVGSGLSFASGTLSNPTSGTVTQVTTTAPLGVTSGTTTPALTITQATTLTDGYLSSTDWNTFKNKVSSVASADGSVSVTTTSNAVDLAVASSPQAATVVMTVYNNTGSTLTTGTVVYIQSASGNLPYVNKALATSDATSLETLGIVKSDITNLSSGSVVTSGIVTGINTAAYSAGQILYLSATTAGALTPTAPSSPNHLVYVAVVVNAAASGSLLVNIKTSLDLHELDDVTITSPANGQTIIYDATNQIWVNNTLTSGTGINITNNAGGITINNTGVTSVSGTSGNIVVTGTTTPTINLATSGVGSGSSVGSATLVPVITYDTYGRITGVSTAANPQGTVTGVSVVSANGLAGTVTSGATPAITLSTSVTGLLKGNGTSISAATSGTDYAPATSGAYLLYGNGLGGFSNATISTGLSFSGGVLRALPRIVSTNTFGSNIYWNSSQVDLVSISAQVGAVTIDADSNPVPLNGQKIMFRITGGIGGAIIEFTTGDYGFVGIGIPLTSISLAANTTVVIGAMFNPQSKSTTATPRWEVIAITQG